MNQLKSTLARALSRSIQTTRFALIFGVFLLVSCGGHQDNDTGNGAEQSGFWISSPTANTKLEGTSDVSWQLEGHGTVVSVSSALDDQRLVTHRVALPFALNSLVLENGEHRLTVVVETSDGAQLSDSVSFEVDNPEQRLVAYESSQPLYAPSEEVLLDLAYNLPDLDITADFSNVDGSTTPVSAIETEPRHYQIRHVLGSVQQARKDVVVRAANAAGRSVENPITLELRAQPSLPIEVARAYFIDDDEVPYEVLDASESLITSISGSPDIVTGVPSKFTVAWDDPDNDLPGEIIVKLAGYAGYYVVPVAAGQTELDLELLLPSYKPGSDPSIFRVFFAKRGYLPKIAFSEMDLHPAAVRSGGLQFLLRWDKPADLDLAVTGPDGIINYDTPAQGGGRLDLDANTFCITSSHNVENVAWQPGTEKPGNYEVHVNLTSACDQEEINYEVIVQMCGKSTSIPGVLHASDVSSGEGRLVAPPIKNECTKQVRGAVKYQKADGSFVPAPRVPIRAVRADKTVLAQGFTKKDGSYSLTFGNTGTSKYRVQVDATWADPVVEAPRASVAELGGETVYSYTSAELDSTSTPAAKKDIFIKQADSSGAFNIVNVVRRGLEWLYAERHEFPEAIGVRWSPGTDLGGSFYKASQIYLNGSNEDPDAFDDSVIAHELMHHVVNTLSKDSSDGAPHDGGPAKPPLAWAEGIATALGQIALGSSVYTDTGTGGAIRAQIDIETARLGLGSTPAGFAQGTSNGKQDGNHSEYLVAAIVWDLHDDANESHDSFAKQDKALSNALFDLLPHKRTDRAQTGVDLVDFLDVFRCSLDAKHPSASDTDLRPLLNERKFPYDFASVGLGCGP